MTAGKEQATGSLAYRIEVAEGLAEGPLGRLVGGCSWKVVELDDGEEWWLDRSERLEFPFEWPGGAEAWWSSPNAAARWDDRSPASSWWTERFNGPIDFVVPFIDHEPVDGLASSDEAMHLLQWLRQRREQTKGRLDRMVVVSPVLDGWSMRVEFQSGENGPDPIAIDLRKVEPASAVGARVLRRLGFGAVMGRVDRFLRSPAVRAMVGEPWSGTRVRRPGRAKADHHHYAEVAARYVRALAVDHRAPYRVMVDEYASEGIYETENALRTTIRRARNAEILTEAEGRKAGGVLTSYGRWLAIQIGLEV